MKLQITDQMRLEQKMKLAPRMIQSMEILQLPLLALQERIEQEINSNPVLEIAGGEAAAGGSEQEADIDQKEMVVGSDAGGADDFQRLDSLGDDFQEYLEQAGPIRRVDDGPDRKLEAMKNTAARAKSLHEHLAEQWGLVEADDRVKAAGEVIIDNIDARGYLTLTIEQIHAQNKDYSPEELDEALRLVQNLEPAGVGARDLAECLVIQMRQDSRDLGFEIELVEKYMTELLENRLPDIARKANRSLEEVKKAIERMSRFDTSPGLQLAQDQNHPITADVIIEYLEEENSYQVRLADSSLPSLKLNKFYMRMATDSATGEKTRKFLRGSIQSARWIIEAVEQRKKTLLAVTEAIVRRQIAFFEKGPQYLKPLPMAAVAGDVGIHLATVSRAVAGKYALCHWGTLPLRKFFSGGVELEEGRALSWEAIRVKLQQIINTEDKARPLSDEKICRKLAAAGIKDLARRTVAKYRKLMNIPPARLRKRY